MADLADEHSLRMTTKNTFVTGLQQRFPTKKLVAELGIDSINNYVTS